MVGKVTLENLATGEVPTDILEQLKILNRISFSLKNTSPSSYSSSASNPDSPVTEKDPAFDVDRLIDSVKDLEDLIEQLEDVSDELLKDMEIPFPNDLVKAAVQRLNPEANSITKEVLDKALAIIDYFPMMMMGQDPFLGGLTGDSTLNGPYLNCNEITKALGDIITVPPRNEEDAERTVADKTMEVQEKWEKRMDSMFLEIILQLWWNILWPKFIVDLAIINPARNLVALPLDTLIVFFTKDCGGRFKRPSKECLIGSPTKTPPYSDAKGPLNKILNAVRLFLLCTLPPKIYPRYKPMLEFDCTNAADGNCPPSMQGEEKPSKDVKDIGAMLDEVSKFSTCQKLSDWAAGVLEDKFDSLGMPPECAQAAKTVLDAVLADALTPGKKAIRTATASFISKLNKESNI